MGVPESDEPVIPVLDELFPCELRQGGRFFKLKICDDARKKNEAAIHRRPFCGSKRRPALVDDNRLIMPAANGGKPPLCIHRTPSAINQARRTTRGKSVPQHSAEQVPEIALRDNMQCVGEMLKKDLHPEKEPLPEQQRKEIFPRPDIVKKGIREFNLVQQVAVKKRPERDV